MNKRIFKKHARQVLYPQITYLLEEYSLKDILHSAHKDPVNSKNVLSFFMRNKDNQKIVLNITTSQKDCDEDLAYVYHKTHHLEYYMIFPDTMNLVHLTPSAHHYLNHLCHHFTFKSLVSYAALLWDLDKDNPFDLSKLYHKYISKNA